MVQKRTENLKSSRNASGFIRQTLGSNLRRDDFYTDWGFSWFFSASRSKYAQSASG
jgi:hypothetical protein